MVEQSPYTRLVGGSSPSGRIFLYPYMLIDEITIRVRAGSGGNGAVAFSGNLMTLGPTGSSGGRGGSVYLEGVSDLGALTRLRHTKVFEAEDGTRGRRQLNDGPAGEDMTIKVPVGTVVHDVGNGSGQEIVMKEIISIGERMLVAKGGRGGKGNFHFRGPTNTTPREFEEGKPGEERILRLELKMIADIGLIGLPNAGKSSLLNELTRAQARVANYPFTTLEPNLGVWGDLVLADIPGLIEGASAGRGLGIKFLRHVERTRVLFHLVSAESDDPVRDYRSIRAELGAYEATLLDKEEYVFLSKSDLVLPREAKKKLSLLKKCAKRVALLSIHDVVALAAVQKILTAISKEKHAGDGEVG